MVIATHAIADGEREELLHLCEAFPGLLIDRSVIGLGCVFFPPVNIWDSVLGAEVQIGAFCNIGGARIGDRCRIGPHVSLPEGTVLEEDVFVGPGAVVCNDRHPSVTKAHMGGFVPRGVTIRRGAVIGANATLCPGITIGEEALVGAGSVVTKDVPAGEQWAGNPARRMR